jgi:hypothetical protein
VVLTQYFSGILMRLTLGDAARKPVRAQFVDRELTLREMLADPIVIRVMRRDGVTHADIVRLFSTWPWGRSCRIA